MNEPRTTRHERRRLREEKVLAALRHEGLLASGDSDRFAPRRRNRSALAIAAGLLIALTSGAVGYQLGERTPRPDASSPAVRMQQSGDAYVRALRELLHEADSLDPAALAQGREAALAVMLSGAAALSESMPDPAVAQAITHLRVSRGNVPGSET